MSKFLEGLVFLTFAGLLVYAVYNMTRPKKIYTKTKDDESYKEL